MRPRVLTLVTAIATLAFVIRTTAQSQSDPVKALLSKAEEHTSLTAPGSQPFHLKLRISDSRKEHIEFDTAIEIWWAAPDKWRREIKSSIFSQTAVQDGPRYSESNSSDYLPWWLHNIIGESLDPLPMGELQSAGEDLEADNNCLKWEKTFAEGTDQIGIHNSICFSSDGNLREVFTRTAGVQFQEYRDFGSKSVARSLESETYTADRKYVNLKTAITFIEPLKETAGFFRVIHDTGLNARLRFVNVPESALDDLKFSTPLPQWPVVHNFPSSGMMTVNLKIDRQGVVREVGSPISRNVVLSDPAKEELKNWKFQPFLVDGAPVQVNVDVSFKFEAKWEPYGANARDYPAATFLQRIDKSRELSDLRTEGGKPFHLRASFQYNQDSPGSYDEIWLAPSQWRRQATLGNVSVTESQDGDHLYRKLTGADFSPRKIDDFLDDLAGQLPRTDGSFQEGDWGQSAVVWDRTDMLRVARGQVDANNVPITGQAYWFDSTGLLRGSFVQPRLSTYANFLPWNAKQVPRNIEVSENGDVVLRVSVQQIDSPAPSANLTLAIEGVKPTSVNDADNYSGPPVVQPAPIHRADPVDPHSGRGTVVVNVSIDPHGHVRSVTIRQSAGKLLDDAALHAAMKWEFTPMMIHGHVVPGSATLTFKF
jgi:TonB family protein